MLSALKKLTVNNSKHEGEVITPRGLQMMPRVLQNKFSKGVQYNMKIIIKGDRNVGKSCLFNRLQGRSFIEKYTPTEEIQVTSIQWNYKATDDIVKVEVWDVVDKSKKRVLSGNLKLGTECREQEVIAPALDAEFLNVYKNTNGVILVMDITKNWTFEYVQREIEKIPSTIPVLILGNHCDMSHHRSITPDHVVFYIDTLQRSSPTRYAEGSMYNGFGLKFLHKWFNLPFLQLQKETLLAQLITNENEISITTQELDLYQQSDDSDYKVFLEKLTSHRRKVAESNSFVPTSSIMIRTQHNFSSTEIKDMPNKITLINNETSALNDDLKTDLKTKLHDQRDKEVDSSVEMKLDIIKSKVELPVATKLNLTIRNIEEFVPDDHLDKSFLEESSQIGVTKFSPSNDSDSDHEVGNPLVSGFQDDLDPEDIVSENGRLNQDLNDRSVTAVNNLERWMVSESRGSPDGGDDISKTNDTQSFSKLNVGKDKSDAADKTKHKKITKKKKKSESSKTDELESFFNSDYEAL